jgi:hypothetical protein
MRPKQKTRNKNASEPAVQVTETTANAVLYVSGLYLKKYLPYWFGYRVESDC